MNYILIGEIIPSHVHEIETYMTMHYRVSQCQPLCHHDQYAYDLMQRGVSGEHHHYDQHMT